MINYNQGDDIKLRLQVRNRGEVINPAEVRWTVRVYTESRDKAVLCTHDDSGYSSNCYVQDNYIVLAIDNPALVSGILRVMITLYYEDDDMSDGYRTETVMMREVESLSDSIVEGVADISVVGYSAYRIAVLHGFEGTEEEWLASLKGEPGRDGADADIEGCNEAIERANAATDAAKSATADALSQAKYAKEQGDNAKGQGDYAKEQGNYAKEQGDYAKSQGDATKQAIADSKAATENANTAASNANTESANAKEMGDYAKAQGDYAKAQGDATKQAIADAKVATENANTAASNANTEATYAKEQGDYAKEQGDFVKQFISNPDDLLTYGVEIDTTSSSPTLKRIGNPQLHKSLPIQSKMKGCLLNDNGNVTKYLSDNDWVDDSSFIDGTEGQVMVEIPKFYYKFETDGDIQRVRISEYPLSGYKLSNTMYVGAYEASLQRSTLKLCSVCNYDADYRGGNNQSQWDDTYRSVLGRPATYISRINFRKYARNRNTAITNWNILTYQMYKMIYWLYTIEYASLNSQLGYNAELTSEGYHQGGLGAGVTNWSGTSWNNFNGYNPFVPCGYTNSLGNGTGIVPYEVKDVDDNVLLTTNVTRYRGIENPFGHIWKFIDGINIRISPNEENGGDGLSKVYVCKNTSLFSDTNYDGYDYVGDEARQGGFVKKLIFGEDGEIMPLEVGGGTTSYFCDYHYSAIPTSLEGLRAVLFGGYANDGSLAGFACATSAYAPSNAPAYFGSRLCYIK